MYDGFSSTARIAPASVWGVSASRVLPSKIGPGGRSYTLAARQTRLQPDLPPKPLTPQRLGAACDW